MGTVSAWISVYYVYKVPMESARDTGSPGTAVTEVCELPCRCWEPSPEHFDH